MELTHPASSEDIRTAYPRDTRGMELAEISVLLRACERAIRAQFGVVRTDEAADGPMRDAIIAAWPSFIQQVRQVKAESVGTDSASVTYGSGDIAFPGFIGMILFGVMDETAARYAPSYTQLVR